MNKDADKMVAAIRADKVVGKGTCSSIDECYEDAELAAALAEDGITSPVAAVRWARDTEELFLEQGLNARWGEDDDPQLLGWNEFQKTNRENPV